VVVFVLGYADDALSIGPLRQLEQYRSWARLVAAEGMVGVLYSTTEPRTDLVRVMELLRDRGAELGVDPGRIALWSASANGPLALWYVRSGQPVRARALVAAYALLPTPDGYQSDRLETMSDQLGFALPRYSPADTYPTDLPILIVRAGRDRPGLLAMLDRFVAFGLEGDLAIQVRNYPQGRHSFDSVDDVAETREVVADMLSFLAEALGVG
jgi:acetyl esterase/lipase